MIAIDSGRLDDLLTLVRSAGSAILAVYHASRESPLAITHKADNSPVTQADRASHEVLSTGLSALFPSVPVISEEADIPPYAQRQAWEDFWLVDPLDGTRHFLQHDGQFVISVARIHHQTPVFGLIYAPVEAACYYGGPGQGCFRQIDNAPPERLSPPPFPTTGPVRVLASTRDTAIGAWLDQQGREITRQALGSALKFCRLAEGEADMYARSGPTMEWDIAAGHALALGCGKTLTTLPDGGPFLYNKPSLKNPGFVCR